MNASLRASSLPKVTDGLQCTGGLLIRAAMERPGSGVIYSDNSSHAAASLCTYPALFEQAMSLLNGLRAADIGESRKVLLQLERAEDFIPMFWACCLGGMVACPLPPQQGNAKTQTEFFSHLTKLFDNPVLITTAAQRANLAALAHMPIHELESLRGAPPAQSCATPEIDDPAIMMLTSGSTGQPKAVVLTHRNLRASMQAKIGMLQLTPNEIALNWITFDHVAGLLEGHLLGVALGC